MKKKDNTLPSLTLEELHNRLAKEQEAYQTIRFSHVVSPIENPSKIRFNRRNIARIKTFISQKMLHNDSKKS